MAQIFEQNDSFVFPREQRPQKSGRNQFAQETNAGETKRGEIRFTVTSDCRKITVPFNLQRAILFSPEMFQKLNGTEIFLQSDVTVNQISPRFVSLAFVSRTKWFLPDFCCLRKYMQDFRKKKIHFCTKIERISNRALLQKITLKFRNIP